MMMKSALISFVGCLLAIQLTDSAPVSILDVDAGLVDLENIAKNICWKNSGLHNQISRISTIGKLVQYFDALPIEHQFSSCAKRNLALLRQLDTLLATGNENVCSNEKLTRLESFHHNYISNQRHARLIEAPKMIKTFFMHYSAQISEMCAQQSVEFFAETSQAKVSAPALDRLLKQHGRTVGSKDKLDSYDDLFFVWGVVDSLPKGLHAEVADYVVSGPKRITVKSKNAQAFSGLQQMCLDVLKPVYSSTLLPSMRLIDLGYYPSATSSFLHQLNENPLLSRLYKLTLLCETSLPMRVIEGQQGNVLVKPEELSTDDNVLNGELEKSYVRPEPVGWTLGDRLPTVTESQAKQVAKRVADELGHRRRHLWKTIKRVLRGMKKSSSPENTVILSESKRSLEAPEMEGMDKEIVDWDGEDDDSRVVETELYSQEDSQLQTPARKRRAIVVQGEVVELDENDHANVVEGEVVDWDGEDDDSRVVETEIYSQEDPQLRFPTRRRRESTNICTKIMKVLTSLSRIIVSGIIFAIKLAVGLLMVTAIFLATVTSLDEVRAELNRQLEMMNFS